MKKLISEGDVAKVFAKLAKTYPDAHCELDHKNHFQLLIAVVLSAQATDKSVNRALAPVIEKNPDFDAGDLIALGQDGFLKIIKSIGLANTKSRNCYALAQQLMEKFDGKVPSTREELESLPGVGRKTANVVLNVLFGEPTMAVDTHVARLAVRLGLVKETNDRVVIEEKLLEKVPSKFAVNAHHLLIFHGRYCCTARAPACPKCPVEELCPKIGVEIKKNGAVKKPR